MKKIESTEVVSWIPGRYSSLQASSVVESVTFVRSFLQLSVSLESCGCDVAALQPQSERRYHVLGMHVQIAYGYQLCPWVNCICDSFTGAR